MAMDLRRLREEWFYTVEQPLKNILEDLGAIAGEEARIRAMRMKLRIAAAVALVLGILLAAVAPALFILGAITALGIFIYSFIYGRSGITHAYRNEFCADFIKLLARDSDANARAKVTLSLKDTKQLRSEGPFPRHKDGKQQLYRDNWLSVTGKFLDHTSYSFAFAELLRKRTYKNPGGKTKTKTRSRHVVTLRLTYPARLYGNLRAVHAKPRETVRVPSGALLRSAKVTEKTISLKALITDRSALVPTTGMLLLGGYKMLNFARIAASRKRGA